MISFRSKIISSSEAVFKIDHAMSALSKEISKNDGKAHAALFRINTKSVPVLGRYWRSAEGSADCSLPKHCYLKGGRCLSGRASFRVCGCGLVVKHNRLLSISMAWRHRPGWRRQQSSGAPPGTTFMFLWHKQRNGPKYSSNSQNTASEWGSLQQVQRDGQLTDTTEKRTCPLADNLQSATSPKGGTFINSAEAGQVPPQHPVQWSLGLGHLAHLQWSSMEGEASKQRGLQSLGRITWWCSLFRHQ